MDERNVTPVSLEQLKSSLGAKVQALPCLPPVLLGVQKAVSEANVGARELAHVILADPSLTARVLKLANSLYYAPQQRIRTVTQAILVMGFETVRNLVLGLSVYDMLANLPKASDYQAVWRHSLCCAICSRYFAAKLRLQNAELAFIAGLLHDLGKLMIGQFFPEQHAEVLRRTRDEKITYHKAEMNVLGFTHEEAGRCIAEYWNFSAELTSAVSRHEASTPEELSRMSTPLQRVVAVANQSAFFLYREDISGPQITSAQIQALCQRGLGIGSEALLEIFAQIKAEVSQTARLLNIAIDEWKYESEDKKETGAEAAHPEDERLEFLLMSSDLLEEAHPFPLYWKQTCDALVRVLKLKAVALLIHDRATHRLSFRFTHGLDVGTATEHLMLHLDAPDDLAARAYLERKVIVITEDNLSSFSRLDEANVITALGSHRLAAVPVPHANDTAVLVTARAAQGEAFEAGEVRLLSAFARDLTRALSAGLP